MENDTSLTSLFLRLEREKAAALAVVRDWSEARLRSSPAAGEWPAAGIFDHIVKVEAGILEAVRRGLREPHRIGLRDKAGFLLLQRIFRSERRVKVPASASQVLPDPNPDLALVIQRWDTTQKELAELIQEVRPDQLSLGVFRHPVSGWMTVPQVLEFFSVHIHHHRFQLARLEAASAGR